jgi:DEAD/DEAH box helicase domain-containing protein
VNTQVVGFKKIKFHTMENVGSGELTLPEQEMHTTAFWLTLPRDLMGSLPYGSTERLDGVNGLANALVAIATLLVMCDARDLGVAVGENQESRCQVSGVGCQQTEGGSQKSGVRSQNEKLGSSALAAGGDQSPINNHQSQIGGSELQVAVVAFEPNIYLYDKYPGGVGLSEPLFRMSQSLLEKTQKLIAECPCASGCPSCVGPIGEVGEKGKEVALEILRRVSVDSV